MHVERRAEHFDDWKSVPAPDHSACQNRPRDRHPCLTQRLHLDAHRHEDLSHAFPALTGCVWPWLRSGLALAEPDEVAGRVAERAVPHAVRLINWLLQHIATSGPDVLEGRIAILGAEDDATQLTLGEHLLHYLAVGRGCVGVGKWRLEDDVDVRLALGPDRGPAHALVFDVAAHLQPEKISVEGERLVVVVDGDEAVTKFQVHAITLRAVRRKPLLHFCSVLS